MPHGQVLVMPMQLGHQLASKCLAQALPPRDIHPANVGPAEGAEGLGLAGEGVKHGEFHLEHGGVAAVGDGGGDFGGAGGGGVAGG